MNAQPFISSLAWHVVVQDMKEDLWSWGDNNCGACGRPPGTSCNTPQKMSWKPPAEITIMAAASDVQGLNHCMAVSKGSLYIWGSNQQGDGLGQNQNQFQPTILDMPNKLPVISVAAGREFSLVLTQDGWSPAFPLSQSTRTLYSFGENGDGQLGTGTTQNKTTPQHVPLPDVVSISAGRDHVFAKTREGKFYSWGYNASGQTGFSDLSSRRSPEPVDLPKQIVEVICGGHHTLGLDDDGGLWAWGRNDKGNLGLGTIIPSAVPQRVESIPDPVVAACAGLYHSLALTCAAEVFAWGCDSLNQVGERDSGADFAKIPKLIKLLESPAVWIMAGCYQSAASLENGDCYVWGMNSGSIIGGGPKDKPILVPKIKARPPLSNKQAYKWLVMKFLFLSRYDADSSFYVLPVEILFQVQVMDSDSFARVRAPVNVPKTPSKTTHSTNTPKKIEIVGSTRTSSVAERATYAELFPEPSVNVREAPQRRRTSCSVQ